MRTIAAALLLALAGCSQDGVQEAQIPVQQTLRVQQGGGAAVFERPQVDSPPPKDLRTVSVAPGGNSGRLGVFLLRRTGGADQDLNCLTLEEALKSGALRITEKDASGEVNELRVENTGDVPVYLQAGDTVKGGKQDRTLAVDTLLPPKSGARALDAFCVEPGRWQTRGGGAPLAGAAFSIAEAPATKTQTLAAKLDKNQGKVWDEGRKVNAELAKNSGGGQAADSYVLAAEDPKVKAQVDSIVSALKELPASVPDAVGVAFCRDGRVQTIELYAGPSLFRKLWPKLLRGAATETIGTPAPKEPAAACTAKDVEALLASMEGKAGKAELRPDGQVVRVWDQKEAALFDTEAQGRLLHRQLLTK